MTVDDTTSTTTARRRVPEVPLVPGGLSIPSLQEDHAPPTGRLDRELFARLLPFLRPQGRLLLVAFLAMPAVAGANLVQPLLLKQAIDAVLIDESRRRLFEVVAFYAGSVVLETFFRFVQTYTMQLAGQRSMADLRRAVFAHIQRLPLRYFDRTPSGRIVTRATNDVDGLSELFASGAVTAVADVVTLLGIVLFMFALDWRLSLVTLTVLPVLAVVVDAFRRRARTAFREIRRRIAQLNSYLAEQVQGIAVVQALSRQPLCATEYRAINDAYREANLKSIRYDALLYSVVEAVATATVALLLWYAGVRAGGLDETASAAWVGTVVAFYEYIQRFFIPVRDLSTKFTVIQASFASAERIVGLLDEPAEDGVARPATAALPTSRRPPGGEADGGVGDDAGPAAPTASPTETPILAFEGVTFGYDPAHPVLHEVSFTVDPGETIALVGATGAGKTTVTSLLLRLYEHQEGRILFRGQDVRATPGPELRRRFAVVPQDVFLFSGTLLENIALEASPDRAAAQAALDRVGATELVADRGGLEARVEERGRNFSAGERQLVAFARALYRSPDVLILDEATANVDTETEARLQSAVQAVTQDRTSLVIAHRLSTVRDADRIFVFHRGRLVESGPHEALCAQGGIYAKLVALQFADPASRGPEASPTPAR